MKLKYFNLLETFKKVFGNKINLDTTFNDVNPFVNITSEEVLPNHIKNFLNERDNKSNLNKGKKNE